MSIEVKDIRQAVSNASQRYGRALGGAIVERFGLELRDEKIQDATAAVLNSIAAYMETLRRAGVPGDMILIAADGARAGCVEHIGNYSKLLGLSAAEKGMN